MNARHLAVVGPAGRGDSAPALPGSGREYDRIVAAALDEDSKKGSYFKFRTAEALALDIPEIGGGNRRPEKDIPARLAEARQAIIDAGGKARSAGTLKDYRLAALWVIDRDLPTYAFRWVTGAAINTHAEARKYGMSYEDFATLPPEDRKVDRIREMHGAATTHGSPSGRKPAKVAKAEVSARKEKRKAELAESAKSRDAIRENAYNTMRNAPPGAQNNPMFWRASKVEALINELRSIEPEVAASNLVPPAFRFFTAENRDWWDRFVTACEKRLADEMPGEKPLKRHPARAPWAESGLDTGRESPS
jgi:hypothetical protein